MPKITDKDLFEFIEDIRDHLRYLNDTRNMSLVGKWVEDDLRSLEKRIGDQE